MVAGLAWSLPAMASTAPFGVLSAYNVVALGDTVLTGNISDSADITGRVAAANMVLSGTTFGSSLNADPYGSLSTYAVVATNGLAAGQSYNINGGGNVFAPGSNGNINFNDGGHRVTTGSSGLDFSSLSTTLEAQSTSLAGLTVNGTNAGTNYPGVNPSFYVLKGTSTTLNVFSINASILAQSNNPLDIITPAGSTTIINVTGLAATVNDGGLYYNGNQVSGDSQSTSNILFNFPQALTVAINSQFSSSVLAPYALLTGSAQMDGTFIAAQVGQTGEIHNVEFTGLLPADAVVTPEPSMLALAGTGLLALAGWQRKRRGRHPQA